MEKDLQRFETEFGTQSARVIAIASGSEGAQGAAMALNLAVCMSRSDKKVCVFEAINRPTDQMLLFSQDSLPTWNTVMSGIVSVEKVIHQGPEGVSVIPMSSKVEDYSMLEDQHRQNLLLAFTQLQYDFDYLIIDRAAGFHDSTTSFLLDSGSIVLTITPQAETLVQAFSLLKGINQRVFQQPVKVVVNLVAGRVEAKQIITRFSIAIRKYLGPQCGSLSFYIMDERMLGIISDARLVTLDYPHSLPSECMNDIAKRLMPQGQAENSAVVKKGTQQDRSPAVEAGRPPHAGGDNHWLSEALHAIESAPVEVMEPIMRKLNEIWQKRARLMEDKPAQNSSFELEILKLKTAIHFASHIGDDKDQKEKVTQSS
jgi:flagellar biosynthesis protein FlhG